jgi:hypothetical protein
MLVAFLALGGMPVLRSTTHCGGGGVTDCGAEEDIALRLDV